MPMDYFLTLDSAALPMHVSDPHALRCIAVLRAAELIEAEIINDAAGHATSATIFKITYQGEAVLAKSRKPPTE